jgi:hypothetical protein
VATARNIASLTYIPDGPNVLKVSLDISSADAVKEAAQKPSARSVALM